MPRAIKFHLDENCDPRIATGLRLHGIDVTTSADAGLLHAPDRRHINYAASQNRVIITQDTDFLRIAAAGTPHAGILFYRQRHRSIVQIVRGIRLIWELCDVDEVRSEVNFL